MPDRLDRRLAFLLELDRAKTVLRRNPLSDGSRRENDAEHSWHLAMAVVVLAEHAADPIEVGKAVRMALVHDIVEIDAGDTFVYDSEAQAGKLEREREAADRLFGMLPTEQGAELRSLWEEFEERSSPEARFVAACDRLLPLMLNHASRGISWQEHGVTSDRVRWVNSGMSEGSVELWDRVKELIDDAVSRGYLPE